MKTRIHQQSLLASAGMAGSALFVAVFLLEGWLRPGYNPMEMFISALSLGPRGWIQVANFMVLGVLLALFTWGVAMEFRNGKASRGGVILLAILAFLFTISGPFVMDPAGTPQSQASLHGTIHGLAGGIVFLLMPITIFVFLRRFRVDPSWQSLRGWTLILGIIEAAAVLVFTITNKSPDLQTAVAGWNGLIQRTALIPFMVWLFIFALGLFKHNEPV
ncbi:MAG TPA: DUF998 domain-containing protein [Anaerolineales bacterium]